MNGIFFLIECEICSTFSNGLGLSCNGTHCTKCLENTTFDVVNQACSFCNATSDCVSCDGVTCANCSYDFFLNEDKTQCLQCANNQNCAECDGQICIKCESGYYRVFNGTYQCLPCSNINNSGICDGLEMVKCLDNFTRVDNLTCTPCSSISNCSKCDGLTCVLCLSSNYLKKAAGGSCISCSDFYSGIDKCVSCWSQHYCKKCEPSYMLSSTFGCQACYLEKNCLSCDGYTCTSCVTGYYLTPQKTCSKCEENGCLSCPYNGIIEASLCTSCSNGYYLHLSSHHCIDCSKNVRGQYCSQCEYLQIDGSYRFNCLVCEENYGIVLQDNTCTECSMAHCLACIYNNDTDVKSCSKCSNGYFLEATGLCASCGLSNCVSCDDSVLADGSRKFLCNSCKLGYFLNSSNECQDCSEMILGCNSCGLDNLTGILQCKHCRSSNYYLNNGSCVSCTTTTENCLGCFQSSQQNLCTRCAEGYYLKNPLNCSQCLIGNCSVCLVKDSGKTCKTCKDGFYLLQKEGYFITNPIVCEECSKLISNCISCSYNNKIGTCLKCSFGYYLNLDSNNMTICSKCTQNCENCLNSTYCNQCSGSYYKQIDSTGQFCQSSNCDVSTNAIDTTNKICTTCSFLYSNCSTCDLIECKTCISANFLMFPTKTFCSECSDSSFTKIDSDTNCAYAPNIDSIERTYSLANGETNFEISCGVPQNMQIYLTYFIYLPKVKESIDYSTIYENFQNIAALNTSTTTIELDDLFWTVYIKTQTDDSGNLAIMISNLKNSGIDYKMQVWCHNIGNQNNVLDILSNMTSLNWFQSDNLGVIIKLNVQTSTLMLNSTKTILVETLTELLQLKTLNREMISNVLDTNVSSEGIYETFFIERDYKSAPYDHTFNIIKGNLSDISFINKTNEALKTKIESFSIIALNWDTINSATRKLIPELRSLDFTRIFSCSLTTANFSLEIINTNGFIYIGFANRTDLGNVDWNQLKQGLDPNGDSLNRFEKVYLKIGEIRKWEWKGLSPNQGYTIYLGAINEDKFENAVKTTIQRVVFKTKGNEDIE